jgi:hypothetical protein
MKKIYTSLTLCLLAFAGHAQHICISQQNPPMDGTAQQLESELQRWLEQHPQAASAREVVQIPTVVHVIWKNPQENLADSLIHRTIELVNKDWRRQNDDTVNTPTHFLPVAADMGIELVLASIDPEGNATDGITRTYSDSTEFSMFHEHMKYDSTGGKTAWNPDQYLNIWTVRSIDQGSFGGITLGMSTMPGLEYDVPGVVIRSSQFTSDEGSRTLTHELGHYFCLLHLCAGDTCSNADLVDDTPICDYLLNFVFECSDSITYSCDSVAFGDMRSNFMGYTTPSCANLFTQGQRERTIGCINTNYPGLPTSPGLGIGAMEYSTIAIHPNPTKGALRFEATTAGAYAIVDLIGRTLMSSNAIQGQNTLDMTTLPNGIYLLRMHNGASARVVKAGN